MNLSKLTYLICTAIVLTVPVSAVADDQHLDDVIISSSLCVGEDCNNGESFGFDTIRLKENNLRIRFQDTSTTASFPGNDWQITANDTSNGGANKFSIDDIDSGKTPFTIEASAPSHSLYVEDDGRIGLGTSTPVVNLHIAEGNSPTMRLEQDGSAGFTPQIWDVAGNETNFFIRDTTNGNKLPFKIRPGAPNDSLFVAADGKIGLGTASPAGTIHARNTSNNDEDDFVVTSEGKIGLGTTAPDQNLDIEGSSAVGIDLNNTGSVLWRFRSGNAGNLVFVAPDDATTVAEFTLDTSGNLTLAGDLVTGGTGTCAPPAAACDGVFLPGYLLLSIDEQSKYMWKNAHLPAVGPTLENKPINLTQKTTGILQELEKAHIYIEQLHNRLAKLETKLESSE